MNNDSHLDIAVAGVNSASNGYVVIFYNNPSDPGNSFTRSVISVGAFRYTNCIAAATMDNDADLDLAVGGYALDPNGAQITLYENDNGFSEVDSIEGSAITHVTDILMGRFWEGDSLLDIVAAHDAGNTLRVLKRNSGNFSFDVISVNGPSSGNAFRYSVIAGGRLNTDGNLEVVGTQIVDGDDDLDVFRQVDGELVHQRPGDTYDVARNTTGIDIAHLDPGSGRDVVFGLLGTTPGIGVLAGNNDGTLDPSPLYAFGNGEGQGEPLRVIAVDMNDDEVNDIVCTNSANTVTVLINDSTAQ